MKSRVWVRLIAQFVFFSSSIRCIVWNLNIIAIGITLVIYTKHINENLWYKIPTLELWVWDLGSGSPMFSMKLNNDSKRNWWTLVYEVIPNLKLIKMKWAFYEEEKGGVYYSYFKSYILHYQFFFSSFLGPRWYLKWPIQVFYITVYFFIENNYFFYRHHELRGPSTIEYQIYFRDAKKWVLNDKTNKSKWNKRSMVNFQGVSGKMTV